MFTCRNDTHLCHTFGSGGYGFWSPSLLSTFQRQDVVSLWYPPWNARRYLSWNEKDFSKMVGDAPRRCVTDTSSSWALSTVDEKKSKPILPNRSLKWSAPECGTINLALSNERNLWANQNLSPKFSFSSIDMVLITGRFYHLPLVLMPNILQGQSTLIDSEFCLLLNYAKQGKHRLLIAMDDECCKSTFTSLAPFCWTGASVY